MSNRSGGPPTLRSRRGHKERSKNFTELEKRTVLELIARHRDVLRQGRSNNATNRSKQLVWSTICAEVNARCRGERPRTPAQVKMWYENYKKKCKMRAHEQQPTTETASLLDGMLWQSLHPLEVKEEEECAGSGDGGCSTKEDDCEPVNMSNGRHSSNSEDTVNVLEPQVQISPSPRLPALPLHAIQQVRLQENLNYLHKLNELTNTPLNLSHLDNTSETRPYCHKDNGRHIADDVKLYSNSATEEEKLYFATKRKHALYEHEAKMKILDMELKQKEEIFSLQKQLFLIELKLKMDFLEKATSN